MGLFDWLKRGKAGDTIKVMVEGGGKAVKLRLPSFVQGVASGERVRMSADSGDYWHLFKTDETDNRHNDLGVSHPVFAWRSTHRLTALAVAASVALVAAAATGADYGAVFREAQMHYKGGQYADAVAKLEEVAAQSPGEPDVYMWLGWALRKQDDRDGARKAFQKCHELKPDDGRLPRWLGDIHAEEGDYASAVLWYEKCLKVEPTSKDIPEKLADARQRLGDDGEEYTGRDQSSPVLPNAPSQATEKPGQPLILSLRFVLAALATLICGCYAAWAILHGFTMQVASEADARNASREAAALRGLATMILDPESITESITRDPLAHYEREARRHIEDEDAMVSASAQSRAKRRGLLVSGFVALATAAALGLYCISQIISP